MEPCLKYCESIPITYPGMGGSYGTWSFITHYSTGSRLRRPSGPLKYRTYAPDRICGRIGHTDRSDIQTNRFSQSIAV